MEQYQSEEEQVEALKKWWNENGQSTLVAIALALLAGFGWQGWQDHQRGKRESASIVYEEMLQAVTGTTQEGATPEQLQTASHLAGRLKSEFDGTSYAVFAAFHLARLAVEEGNLAEAEAELRWVLDQRPESHVQELAELRLGRVLAATGELEAALALLTREQGANAAAFAEARGDVYLQMDQPERALEQFERALAAALTSGETASSTLQLKVQVLSPTPPREIEQALSPTPQREIEQVNVDD